MAEGAREQRDEQSCERLDAAAEGVRAEVGAATPLGAVDDAELGHELRQEAQRDAEDHAQLVGGNADARKRRHQTLEGRRDVEGRGRQGEQAHPHEQKQQATADEDGRLDALLADADDAELEVDVAALDEEHVQERRQHYEHKQGADGPDGLEQRDAARRVEAHDEQGRHRQRQGRRRAEHRSHEHEGQDELHPGIHGVNQRVLGPVLADDGAIRHRHHRPRRRRRQLAAPRSRAPHRAWQPPERPQAERRCRRPGCARRRGRDPA